MNYAIRKPHPIHMKLLENTFQPNPNIFFHSILSILLYLGENYVYLKEGGGGCKISHSHLFKLLSVANYKNKMMYFFSVAKQKKLNQEAAKSFVYFT